MIFHDLSETQQLWMEGGQHSIRSLAAEVKKCQEMSYEFLGLLKKVVVDL